jgi:hypothetical protein
MKDIERFENLLNESALLPEVPVELRASVAKTVGIQLKRKTLIDDFKLLSARFGLLFVVFAGAWIAMSSSTSSLKQLTNSNWPSAQGGQAVAKISPQRFRHTLSFTNPVQNPSRFSQDD